LVVDAVLAGAEAAVLLAGDGADRMSVELGEGAAPREVLRSVALDPGGERTVAFVPAGSGTPADRLGGGSGFAALAGRLARAYDLVVYVAPPVLDGEDADAVLAAAEATVVLAGTGLGLDEAEEAARLLADTPVRVVAAYGR
ncbi:MAG: hypothetical protein KDB46_11570, partial [Solirubrobacterales bacterium]|nr:hypothetical protein [Solirubrobacterales bacterium]